jgi:trehalose synthase
MDDAEANALVVNALQRRADVVAQKSLAEGFGLTVTEAMWKARAVVASRVGGIADQIVDGESGLLVDDPTDLNSFGQAVRRVLRDRELAVRLAAGARARVATRFLPQHYFANETQLFRRVMKQSGTVRPLEPIARAFTRS